MLFCWLLVHLQIEELIPTFNLIPIFLTYLQSLQEKFGGLMHPCRGTLPPPIFSIEYIDLTEGGGEEGIELGGLVQPDPHILALLGPA